MRRQKMLQHPSPIQEYSSAALLAMKPRTGTKRTGSSTTGATGISNKYHLMLFIY